MLGQFRKSKINIRLSCQLGRKLSTTPLRPVGTTDARNSSIDFNDAKNSFKNKTTSDLLRSYVVFSICQTRFIVKHSETLLKLSYAVLGKNITNIALKSSFFSHFCAGENEILIKPTVQYLNANGVGSILDYASESDVQEESESANDKSPEIATKQKQNVQCRVYDYKDEVLCDAHAKTFRDCIQAVHNVSPTGFAAIKCTALGNPKLLETVSTAITELKKLFQKFDEKNTGFVTRDQFRKAYSTFFVGGNVDEIFGTLDMDHNDSVDYIEWTNGFAVDELHKLTNLCRETGPLKRAILDENERLLFQQMRKRIFSLAELAKSLNVRLMIDAEHTYFQPAIDYITRDLAKNFNKEYPVIFGTYQMYLKDSRDRLFTDIERANQGGYKFAAKLVRGAYMQLERERAKQLGMWFPLLYSYNKNISVNIISYFCIIIILVGYEDPIQPSLDATHANYNACLQAMIERIKAGSSLEIMIASHNQKSVELAIDTMRKLQLPPSSSVYFGQLLGMSDHISFSLGKAGYKAYKYVPYGKVEEVMPYLLRRAQENSDALGGAKKELKMVQSELARRIFGI